MAGLKAGIWSAATGFGGRPIRTSRYSTNQQLFARARSGWMQDAPIHTPWHLP
jgi:hypothetical protein